MWDGLVRLAQHALDTDLPPSSHGARPRVTVTIDADSLTGNNAGTGVTEDGLDVPGSAVRRMACDGDLIRVLLDAHGGVLDVGRDHRLVSPAIWTALVAGEGAVVVADSAATTTAPLGSPPRHQPETRVPVTHQTRTTTTRLDQTPGPSGVRRWVDA